MARETKVQREERLQAELAAFYAEQERLWPTRLMSVLERAVKVNFTLTVEDSFFALREPNAGRYDTKFFVNLRCSSAALEDLDALEFKVKCVEDEVREAQRKLEVKANALAKLTAEEREVLGL